MNILILNWRGINDPLSGGAELATFEHARNFVKNHDAKVVWLCPRYENSPNREVIEGVEFIYIAKPLKRDSAFNLLITFPYFYLSIFYKYLTNYRKTTDVIIDQVHGLPYLTPVYSNKKIVVYIHEVAGDIWNKMYKFPINKLGRFFERFIFLPYRIRAIKFVVVSKSTKQDLVNLGIGSENIKIVNNGVSIKPLNRVPKKSKIFTLVFLNRLVKMKGVERAIKVFAKYQKINPKSHLVVIGRGEKQYVEELILLCKQLGVLSKVTFNGYVSQAEKVKILLKSNVLLNTSYKEGWGLVNIEANTQATPVVAFKVPGNIESVKSGVNGYLVDDNDIEGMVDSIVKVKKYSTILQHSSLQYSKNFKWSKQSAIFYNVLSGKC